MILMTFYFIDFLAILVYYCTNKNFLTYLYSTDYGITFRKAYANFYFLKSSLIYYPDKNRCYFVPTIRKMPTYFPKLTLTRFFFFDSVFLLFNFIQIK